LVETHVKISLFITCYNDTLFPETGKAVVRVLERLGHTVEFRPEQTCCGQMHLNTGYRREAVPLMTRFVDVFEDAEVICCPSSSCVAMIREHFAHLAAESASAALHEKVQGLIPRIFEFTELLVDKLGVSDTGAFYPHKVTYHPSCHSLRTLGLGNKPIRLLESVKGLRYVALPEADQCCGFGGTFSIKNPDVSAAMLAEKLNAVAATGAEVCAACDNSCLMHIYGGMHRQRQPVRVAHLAEILASEEAR
jgi:L-lactate dehydrogenase complex protein LldE